MRRIVSVAVLSVVALLFVSEAFSQSQTPMKTVSGTVYDDVSGYFGNVEIAPKWQVRGAGYVPQSPDEIGHTFSSTSGEFRFSMQKGWWAGLLAYDKSKRHGAIAAIPKNEAPEDVALHMSPLARVHYRIETQVPEFELNRVNMGFYYEPAKSFGQSQVLSYFSPLESSVLLPPGKYQARYSGGTSWEMSGWVPFEIKPGDRSVDLGTLPISPIKWAAFPNGIPPELEFSNIRGLPDNFTLKSLTGKWVLLDFWYKDCGPCHRDMVRILDLSERFQSKQDQFEIIMINGTNANDFEAIDESLPGISEKYWNGRMPDYPMLLDGNQKIRRTFGVRLFPTKILISPRGKVVTKPGGTDAIDQLATELQR